MERVFVRLRPCYIFRNRFRRWEHNLICSGQSSLVSFCDECYEAMKQGTATQPFWSILPEFVMATKEKYACM